MPLQQAAVSVLKYFLLFIVSLSFIVLLGIIYFTVSRPQRVIDFIKYITPTGTPAPLQLKGIAVIGDSQSDEYRADDARGFTYSETTRNWVELLADKRSLPFGIWGSWDEPRRTGYEYNWARSGATTLSMLASGQHIGAAEQVREGKVNVVIFYVGANDFAPYITPDGYEALYERKLSDPQILEKSNTIVANVQTAIDTVRVAGDVKILLILIPDWGNNTAVQVAFPLPHHRARVTRVIETTNEELKKVAVERNIAFLDPNQFYRELFSPGSRIRIGEKEFNSIFPSDNPQSVFLSDGIHTGTALNGLFANEVVEHLNTFLGTKIVPLQDADILSASGL
jgi:lysophospholipase L1-like esterase